MSSLSDYYWFVYGNINYDAIVEKIDRIRHVVGITIDNSFVKLNYFNTVQTSLWFILTQIFHFSICLCLLSNACL